MSKSELVTAKTCIVCCDCFKINVQKSPMAALRCFHAREMEQFLICCRSVMLCSKVYFYLLNLLKGSTLNNNLTTRDVISLYHSETSDKYKQSVLESLTTDKGNLKLVLATSSLVCEVNMKNIRFVIHFGSAHHTVDNCQQIVHAGRNMDDLCQGILYTYLISGRSKVTEAMEYVAASDLDCLRSKLFSPFNEQGSLVPPKVPGHDCCSFCAMDCKCEGDCTKFPFLHLIDHEKIVPVLPKTPIRDVSNDMVLLVREMIVETSKHHLFLAPPGIVTGLTATCVFLKS